MTPGNKLVLVAVAATFGAILIGWHTQGPLVALACPPYENDYQGYAAQENCAAFSVLLVRTLWSLRVGVGALIHHYRDDINAFSTAAIAIFTGTLWWTTRKSIAAIKITAEAANHSAWLAERALTEHERPWVFRDIVHITWRNSPGVIANDWLVSIREGLISGFPMAQIRPLARRRGETAPTDTEFLPLPSSSAATG